MPIQEQFTLTDKIALVTGASRGLGRAIALAFADAGADIVLISRKRIQLEEVAENIREKERRAWIFPYDLALIDGIPKLYEKILDEVDKIDVLANIAGITYRKSAIDYLLEKWSSGGGHTNPATTPAVYLYVYGSNLTASAMTY